MTTDFDAIVIGAGPAGSMAAWEFANAGWRVLLLDRSNFPREKACGGALSIRAIRAIRDLPFDMPPLIERNIAWQSSNALLDNSLSRATPVSGVCITRRFTFDAYLVEQAVRRGALLHAGEAVQAVRDRDGTVSVTTSVAEYRALCVVLACGAGRRLDRAGKLHSVRDLNAFAIEASVVDLPDTSLDSIGNVVDFDYRAPAAGYSWIFPTRTYLNVGICTFSAGAGALSRSMLEQHFELLVDSLGGALRNVRGAPLGIGGISYVPRGRILMAGDAAGFTSEASGEGIAPALISGRLVARAFIESALTGLPSADLYLVSLQPLRRWLRQQTLGGGKLYSA